MKFSARHAQIQADDEITAQYYEKIAQRRVEERIEKMKSARKTRFDIRLNPFFSRPSEGIAKEVGRQQQELQQIEQKRLQQVAPTHPILLAQMNEPISAYTQFNTPSFPQRQVKHSPQKTKKLRYFIDDDHEGGAPIKDATNTETQKRSCLKSGSIRPVSTATDCSMMRSIQCMKLIYSSNHRSRYQPFLLLDQISQIYIQLVVILGSKSMTGGQFRNFAKYVFCSFFCVFFRMIDCSIVYVKLSMKQLRHHRSIFSTFKYLKNGNNSSCEQLLLVRI